MAYRGKSLKTLRETKEIHLRRISNETRIGMAYLQDLEEERFDRFPGKFYFKSFAREYALSLGLDPNQVVPDLQSAYEEWLGDGARPSSEVKTASSAETRLLHRIAGYLRRVEEV
jgi:cytoskeletal protein RodZ